MQHQRVARVILQQVLLLELDNGGSRRGNRGRFHFLMITPGVQSADATRALVRIFDLPGSREALQASARFPDKHLGASPGLIAAFAVSPQPDTISASRFYRASAVISF